MRKAVGRRGGMTLIEIIVVLAIIAIVTAVSVPTLTAVFDLNQRAAAKDLVDTYRLLQTEAVLRHVTFRIAYNLDQGTWQVEVGDPSALIFSDPEAREAAEKERREQLKRYTRKEIDAGEAESVLGTDSKFSTLNTPVFTTQHSLPGGTIFAWVYTPQYGAPVTPQDPPPEEKADERVVYSHIFPDGTMEYTVVRIVDFNDMADGYTVEVEPFSGEVRLDPDETEIGSKQSWIPSEAPTTR